MKMIFQLLKLIRIDHWIKNILIFIAIFFSGNITNLSIKIYVKLVILFICFSLASSIVYIINDIIDINKDKNHPLKSKRPLASGYFTRANSVIIILIISLLLLFLYPYTKPAGLYVIFYLALNILYSLLLKKISIVDVVCIGIGYILRIKSGGVISDVFVSHWIQIIVFFLTVSIAFAKRRDDLLLSDEFVYRDVQKKYSVRFLEAAGTISFSITLMTYILYTVSEDAIERIGSNKLYLTTILVFIGFLRYIQLSFDAKAGCPIYILKKDKYIHIVVIIWFIFYTIILYGKSFQLG